MFVENDTPEGRVRALVDSWESDAAAYHRDHPEDEHMPALPLASGIRELRQALDGDGPVRQDSFVVPAPTTATARHLDDGEVRDVARPVAVRVAITDRERGAAPEVLVGLTRESFDDGAELGGVLADAVRTIVAMAATDEVHRAEVLGALRRALPAIEVRRLGGGEPVWSES